MMRRLIDYLRKRWCRHECNLRTLRRETEDEVTATCEKCGKVLRGPYGLALPCRWVQ